jgi:hypothetical protein
VTPSEEEAEATANHIFLSCYKTAEMANPAAVTPFPPPPKFYEEFEPHSNKSFQCPAPPPPLEGPYVMYGVRYDTAFAPQDPAAAHRDRGLDIGVEEQSPVATLRLLNRMLPDEYLKLMQVRRAFSPSGRLSSLAPLHSRHETADKSLYDS